MELERINNSLNIAIFSLLKIYGFSKIDNGSIKFLKCAIIEFIKKIAINTKRFGESSLKPRCDINDLRLSFIVMETSIFKIFLNPNVYRAICTIPKIIYESSEMSAPSSVVAISHEILAQKQKVIKKLKLDHIYPYYPSFPKLHTFLHYKVDRKLNFDYRLSRRKFCIKNREGQRSLLSFIYKSDENQIQISPINSPDIFRGSLPTRRKES